MRFWSVRKSRLPPRLQKADRRLGNPQPPFNSMPSGFIRSNAVAGHRRRRSGHIRNAVQPERQGNRVKRPCHHAFSSVIDEPVVWPAASAEAGKDPVGSAPSGDHGRLAAAGTGFDPGNLASNRDQVRERLGGRLLMTSRIGLVAFDVNPQGGPFGTRSRQPVDNS